MSLEAGLTHSSTSTRGGSRRPCTDWSVCVGGAGAITSSISRRFRFGVDYPGVARGTGSAATGRLGPLDALSSTPHRGVLDPHSCLERCVPGPREQQGRMPPCQKSPSTRRTARGGAYARGYLPKSTNGMGEFLSMIHGSVEIRICYCPRSVEQVNGFTRTGSEDQLSNRRQEARRRLCFP